MRQAKSKGRVALDEVVNRKPITADPAEKNVLGCMMGAPDVADEAVQALRREDFNNGAHGEIFAAMVEIRKAGQVADLSTVGQFLDSKQLLDSCGGWAYLSDLSAGIVSILTAPFHIQQVRSASTLRALQLECGRTILDAEGNPDDSDGVLERITGKLMALSENRQGFPTRTHKTVTKAVTDRIAASIKRHQSGQTIDVTSGFSLIDDLTGGLHPGQMIVVAARPGIGKSVAGLQCGVKNGAKGNAVGIISLEMTAEDLLLRGVAAQSSISLTNLRNGNIAQTQELQVQKALDDMEDYPIFWDDATHMTAATLRMKARRLKAKHNVKVIVIDYLQLLSGDEKDHQNRVQEISQITRTIKNTAMELQIPIVVLAQLNRKPGEEGSPQLHHLRESGSIEQDADVVILLSRKDQTEDQKQYLEFPTDLDVAKQRNGPTGVERYILEAPFCRFTLPPQPQPNSRRGTGMPYRDDD